MCSDMVGPIRYSGSGQGSFVIPSDSRKYKPQQECKLTTHCQVLKYLLETSVPDDLIAKAEAEIIKFKQSVGIPAVQYLQYLWEQAPCCRMIYKESNYRTSL